MMDHKLKLEKRY